MLMLASVVPSASQNRVSLQNIAEGLDVVQAQARGELTQFTWWSVTPIEVSVCLQLLALDVPGRSATQRDHRAGLGDFSTDGIRPPPLGFV